MQLLEAVNKVLRSVGESPVSSVTTNHPEVVSILDAIKQANERRQRRGWWFNLHLATLINPPALPAGTIFARPLNRSEDTYPKGGVLYSRKTGAPYAGDPGELEIQKLVDFTELPEEFAEFVVIAASLDYAIAYDADELHIKALQSELEDSRVQVHRLHIRYYEIHKASLRLQGRGWWFNKFFMDLGTDAGGTVVPENVLFAKPVHRHLDYFPRNGRMIDREDGGVVQHSVRCEVRVFVDEFNELPPSFQDYVEAVAELERAQDYLPESSSIRRLEVNMELARRNAQQDHIKYSAVNLFTISSVGVPINRAWGNRYRA